MLRVIAEATAASTGQGFFNELVRCLAAALDARCAFVSHFSDDYQGIRAAPQAAHLTIGGEVS